MSRLHHGLRLILADLRWDRLAAGCQALALAAVIAPLLILVGLKAGVVGALIDRMERDPAMRLITPDVTGANRFDAAWFERWRGRGDVAFVLPTTRAIAAQVELVTAQGLALRVALHPTAAGDPIGVGEAVAAAPAQIALTAEAARRLNLKPGDPVTLTAERNRANRVEPLAWRMTVAATADPLRAEGVGAYVSLPALLTLQAFRDGDGSGGADTVAAAERAAAQAAYPLFRLYARSIRDVPGLLTDLRAEGVIPGAREQEILRALKLDANLKAVLGIILAAAALGALVSLIAGLVSALERRRRDLAVLKLIGYGPGWMVGLAVGQAVAVAATGAALASGLYAAAAAALNALFADSLQSGEAACRLPPLDWAGILGGALVLALVAGLIVGARAARVDPAEEVRNV